MAKKTLTITLDQLSVFDSGDVVDPKSLIKKGLLKKSARPDFIRVVAKGEIDKPLTIKVSYTKTAKIAIEKAKGNVEAIKEEKEEQINA